MSDNNQTYKADNGKTRLDLVSPTFIEAVGKIRTFGVSKYGDGDSWAKVEPKRYMAALLRHINAYRMGEDTDKESGLPHLWHAACNLMFLIDLDEMKSVSFGENDNPLKRMAEALQSVTSIDFGQLLNECEENPSLKNTRICAVCKYYDDSDGFPCCEIHSTMNDGCKDWQPRINQTYLNCEHLAECCGSPYCSKKGDFGKGCNICHDWEYKF